MTRTEPTPHADAVVRAVPEDEAIQAVRDALEKRYRALVARLREAGDEAWADNLSGYNSYRSEPAKCSLAVLEMMVEEIHQLRGRQIAIDDAVAQSRETGEPLVFVQSAALAEAETRAENERLRELANDWQRLADNWQWSARQVRNERNQLKEINDRMAVDRERLIAERDEARAQQQEQESVNAGLRRAYEHACEQRDKYQRRTAEWRQAAADVAVECNMYRDLAKDLYDNDECWFDHHGGCQAHGWLEPGPGEECPDGRAQRLFEGGNDDANHEA